VEHDAGELVSALATVQLNQDAPAIGFVVDKAVDSGTARSTFVRLCVVRRETGKE
jgi:hypothetical protein